MKASVVIVTKDRKDDLYRAIKSAIQQTESIEVLVLDDGSSDGTSEMVRAEFPEVRLHRSSNSVGCVVQRNRAATLCSGEIIFSIDDDAEFSTPHIIEQTLAEFGHPRVAAVAIPYVEPQKSDQAFQNAPDGNDIWVAESFRGTAYALRRDLFVEIGGYRDKVIHQGEEVDFCIRLLDRGFVVRLGFGDFIIHHEAARRDWHKMDYYGRRNDVLFAWRNVPMPYLPVHLIATTCNGLACAVRREHPSAMLRGLMSAYYEILNNWRCREPVSRGSYKLHRLLKKGGARPLDDILRLLPDIAPSSTPVR
jgi:glycosyltransferase involved in cell wall biosynthesis